jgi:hypothetical protein
MYNPYDSANPGQPTNYNPTSPVMPNGQVSQQYQGLGNAVQAAAPSTPTSRPPSTSTSGGTASGAGGYTRPNEIGGGLKGVPPDLKDPFPPYKVPNPFPGEQGQMGLLMQLLQNPLSMSPDIVNMMKAQNKESALSMTEQLLGQANQSVVGRGLSPFGGQAQSQQRRANEAAIQNILQGNRAIDIQKSQQDRQDMLGVLDAANSVLGGQQGRNLNAAQFALARALGLGDLALRRDDLGLRSQLGLGQLGLDTARFQQQGQNDLLRYILGY